MKPVYYFLPLALVPWLLALNGCYSRLTAKADVLDESYWISPQPLISRQAPDLFSAYVSVSDPKYWQRAQEALGKAIDDALSKSRVKITPPTRQALQTGVNKEFKKFVEDYRVAIGGLIKEYLDTFKVKNKAEADQHRLEVISGFYALRSHFNSGDDTELRAKLSDLIGFYVTQESTPPVEATTLRPSGHLAQEQTGAVTTAIGEGPPAATLPKAPTPKAASETIVQEVAQALSNVTDLRTDPALSLVVAAPENFWHGPVDGVSARTFYGNGDIALKALDESGTNFTLKGVKLDASKAVAATLNVTRSAVQVMASMYGVVPTPQPPANADPKVLENYMPQIAPQKLEAAANLSIRKNKADRLALLDAMVARHTELTDPDNTKRIAAIEKFLADYGAIINPPAN